MQTWHAYKFRVEKFIIIMMRDVLYACCKPSLFGLSNYTADVSINVIGNYH